MGDAVTDRWWDRGAVAGELGAEVRVCAPPDWAERPADWSGEGSER